MTAPVTLAEAERAAVLVMVLPEQQAAGILRQLGPDELRLLGETMCRLGEVGPDLIAQAIGGFIQLTERSGLSAHGREGTVHALMREAVGPVKADNLMRAIQPDATPDRAIELLHWLTPAAIVPLIQGEHPQAIALLLVQLEPDVAAQVLHALPPAMQPEVVHRVATLGPVSAEALAMLGELIEARIADGHLPLPAAMGGPRDAANIVNQAGKAAEKRIMPEITRIDRTLARTIEQEMFKFEHLFTLDPQAMGTLLREVESETLITALKGIEEAQRDVFFRAMSSRAADGLRDEIATLGRLKLAEVADAQRLVVAAARRLAADGAIAFGAGGGDDEYV